MSSALLGYRGHPSSAAASRFADRLEQDQAWILSSPPQCSGLPCSEEALSARNATAGQVCRANWELAVLATLTEKGPRNRIGDNGISQNLEAKDPLAKLPCLPALDNIQLEEERCNTCPLRPAQTPPLRSRDSPLNCSPAKVACTTTAARILDCQAGVSEVTHSFEERTCWSFCTALRPH